MKTRSCLPALALALALLAAALPLAAQSFTAGNDSWTTPSGGQTQVNLNSFPGALRALGSPVNGSGIINLQGSPLNSTSIGKADTLMARGAISSGNGSLQIIALNLSGSSNVVLQDGRQYALQVCLSDTASTAGTISLTQNNGDGGTFSSSFTVLPKLVFTNVNPPYDKVRIDCAGGGCDPLTMSSSNSGWVQTGGPGNFSPSAKGIPPLPTGNVSVNNCDGSHTVNLTGHGSLYPGFSASTGFPVSPPGERHTDLSWHQPNPPQDCLQQQPLPQGGKRGVVTPAKAICLTTASASQ